MNMGGRGYKNNVIGYLTGDRRTAEFRSVWKSDDGKIDILQDKISPMAPTMPIFSNTEGKIYAILDKTGTKIKAIGFYDNTHRLIKTIHLDHDDGKIRGYHVHDGDLYHHISGYSRPPNEEETKVINKILEMWGKIRRK